MSGHITRQQVPLNDAAQLLGVSTKTVWRKIKKGELPAQKVNGQWLIEVELPSGQSGQGFSQEHDTASGQYRQTFEISTEIQVLKATIEFLRGQLEEKDKQISELHVLLLQKQLPQSSSPKWWQRIASIFKKGKATGDTLQIPSRVPTTSQSASES
jgi:excisionase family DNA binding protein